MVPSRAARRWSVRVMSPPPQWPPRAGVGGRTANGGLVADPGAQCWLRSERDAREVRQRRVAAGRRGMCGKRCSSGAAHDVPLAGIADGPPDCAVPMSRRRHMERGPSRPNPDLREDDEAGAGTPGPAAAPASSCFCCSPGRTPATVSLRISALAERGWYALRALLSLAMLGASSAASMPSMRSPMPLEDRCGPPGWASSRALARAFCACEPLPCCTDTAMVRQAVTEARPRAAPAGLRS